MVLHIEREDLWRSAEILPDHSAGWVEMQGSQRAVGGSALFSFKTCFPLKSSDLKVHKTIIEGSHEKSEGIQQNTSTIFVSFVLNW